MKHSHISFPYICMYICIYIFGWDWVVSFNLWAFSDGAFWLLSLFCWRLLTTEPFLVAPFMYGAYFGGAFGHPHQKLQRSKKGGPLGDFSKHHQWVVIRLGLSPTSLRNVPLVFLSRYLWKSLETDLFGLVVRLKCQREFLEKQGPVNRPLTPAEMCRK